VIPNQKEHAEAILNSNMRQSQQKISHLCTVLCAWWDYISIIIQIYIVDIGNLLAFFSLLGSLILQCAAGM
jgi:hypothetical protein